MKNRNIWNGVLVAAAVLTALLATPILPAYAIKFGDLLKAGGIAVLVKNYGKEMNKGINTVLMNRKIEVKDATKVVPIVSVGQGLIAGAAQVTGPADLVKQVKAVAQIEAGFGKVRVKYLWPIKMTTWSGEEAARVPGVGISALLASRVSNIKL